MEVGHPLPRPAAELSDIVGRGGSAHQSQVNASAAGLKGPGHRHGVVVDAGDVLQRSKRRHLPAQPQQLVYILHAEPLEKPPVLRRHRAVRQFLLRAKGKVQPGVKGHRLPLRVKEFPEKLQKAQRSIPLGGGVDLVRLRVQQGDRHLIGTAEPALLRLRRQIIQQGAERLQGLGAGEALPDWKQRL